MVEYINWDYKLRQYALLMRLDKPIGILLLLWPTLWALWLASKAHVSVHLLVVFVTGVVLMRSAGCVVNDMADRHYDLFVKRTYNRPLAAGRVHYKEAFYLALILSLFAFLLVLTCNFLTIKLAVLGMLLVIVYPLLKRITHLPQVGLGIAFSWGIPMAFAAVQNEVPLAAWFLFVTASMWPLIYDTLYAMVDREDDIKIGIKSIAILFAQYDLYFIAILQIIWLMMLICVGQIFQLTWPFYLGLVGVALLCIYQQLLIKTRSPSSCFKAFLNHHWVGLSIFIGIYYGVR